MATWPEFKKGGKLLDIICDAHHVKFWENKFDRVYNNDIDTWDYCWHYACWSQNGLTVLPSVNLVKNIGFEGNATHTKSKDAERLQIEAKSIDFPLRHPVFVLPDRKSDEYTAKNIYRIKSKYSNTLRTIKRVVRSLLIILILLIAFYLFR